jgi:YD repeat-containing protein
MPKQRPAAFELLLSIGGIAGRVVLEGAPGAFVDQVKARYAAFTLPSSPLIDVGFSLRLTLDASHVAPVSIKERAARLALIDAHPLTVTGTDKTVRLQRWDLNARLAAKTHAAGRRVRWVGKGRCAANPYSLDCVLRVVYSVLLPREDGLLVHSCGLRHAEIGVVFPGASGLGKTTLARKAPDADDVLSDELIALRRTDEGWRVHGTPFWGDFARGGISLRSWPLRALAFLAQRESVVMSPVTSADATLRLLGCVLSFQTDRPAVMRNVALAKRLCEEVRSVEAQLTRTATTAEIFGKLVPHLGPGVERKVPAFSTREMISEFRSFLRKHSLYGFSPKGTVLRPFLKAGGSLLIQAAPKDELDVGDVALYWAPGPAPDDDVLRCHRVGTPLPKGVSWAHAEVLGRVSGLTRDGRALAIPGKLDRLARLFGPEVAMPILRLAGR